MNYVQVDCVVACQLSYRWWIQGALRTIHQALGAIFPRVVGVRYAQHAFIMNAEVLMGCRSMLVLSL